MAGARNPNPWICAALVIATFIVYAQVRRFDFINYDDPDYVTRNVHVSGGLTAAGVRWAFTSTRAANWFPITWLSHMLDCQFFGLNSGLHHLTNVFLHAIASLLLFAFLWRATRARWPAAFVAALFALHPLHVESVAWIAERKDVLSACFWFATLLLYVRWTERPSRLRYAAVAAAFCLGIMAKPMIVTLPFTLLLIDMWPLRRLDAASLPSWRAAVFEKVPLLAIAAAAAVTTYVVQQAGGAVKAIPAGLRISNALVSWVVYISKFLWPSRLAIFYPYPKTIAAWEAILSAAALLAISALVIRAFRSRPYLAVGWFWFAGTLVPVIGLVQVGEQARADRYMYVPMVGLGIMVAWGAADVLGSRPRWKSAMAAAAAILCIVWGALTLKQAQYWGNSETVFQHALEAGGPSYVAEHNLGDYLVQAPGRVSEAIPHLRAALAIRPDSAEAHTDLGSAYAALPGRLGDAISEYRAALSIAPDAAIPHNDLGNALAKSGRLQDAVSEYETALRMNPDYVEAHNNLGAALAQLGRMSDAVAQFQAALNLDPHDPQARRNLDAAVAQSSKRSAPAEAHYNSGLGLFKAGRTQDAIVEFEAALRINPDYAEAHNNLGVALSQSGRLADAMSEFQAALRIQPDYADAHYNAGVALANAGRIQEAEQQLEAAERIKPDPETRRLLDEVRRARR